MSLEGLRAWIGEVERKLGARTRVFLALALVAIGVGGAAIYLAIDARESSVSESDVRALQEKLEARIDEVAAGTPSTAGEASEEAAPVSPETEAQPAPAPVPQPETGAQGRSEGSAGGGAGTESSSGASSPPSSATGGAPSSARLQKLLEEAQKRNAEAEDANKAGK